MNVEKNILLTILILFFISACATITTIKVPADYLTKKTKYAVVAISCLNEIGVVQSTYRVGFLFGVIGALIEEAATKKTRDTLSREEIDALNNKLLEAMSNWGALDLIRDKIHNCLLKNGRRSINIKEVVPLPLTITKDIKEKDKWGKAATRWYNPDETVFDHSQIINKHKPNLIIEAGYQGFVIRKSGRKLVVDITTLVKIIRVNDGKVIGRSRNFEVGDFRGRGIIGGFDLRNEEEIIPFVTKFKTIFAKEVDLLIKESFEELGL